MTKSIRRRRLERKTDYKARLALLKSGRPRLVIRKTNRYVIAQIIESDNVKDTVIFYSNSKDLLQKGWPKELSGSLKSLPAAYLTGLALGKKAKDKVKLLVVDLGMYRNVHKSRIYAVVKGAIDSGLNVPAKSSVLPTEEDLMRNEKTSEIFKKMKEKI